MPCRSDYMEPTPGERLESKQVREELEGIGNRATKYSDLLREFLLGNADLDDVIGAVNHDLDGEYLRAVSKLEGLYVAVPEETRCKVNELVQEYTDLNELVVTKQELPDEELESLAVKQKAHREDDVRRLLRTFASADDRDLLRKTLLVDTDYPLKAQLGFDPDEV